MTSAGMVSQHAGKWHDTFDSTVMDNGFTGYEWFKDSCSSFQAFESSTDGTGSSTVNRFTESCSARECHLSFPKTLGIS